MARSRVGKALAKRFDNPGTSVRSITGRKKVHKVMKEFKEGELHSGSKKGKKVTSRKQAIAIGLSEARRAEHGHKKR